MPPKEGPPDRAGPPAPAKRVEAGGPDVTVVGTGAIGLATALALSDRGLRVTLIGAPRPGESSGAAAGLLAPSIEDTHGSATPGPVHEFALAARDRYVSYLEDLVARSDVEVSLNRLGILELALDDAAADALRSRTGGGEWLDRSQLAALEPGLAHGLGARLYPADGSVDNVALLLALSTAIDCTPTLRVEAMVTTLTADDDGVTCTTDHGETYRAAHAVLAAGAWTPLIHGLPRPIPVEPLRGQMFSVLRDGTSAGGGLRHAVYGPHAYFVPRGDQILVGATLERVGFDPRTTDRELGDLRTGARPIWPALADAPIASRWAGLRPMTPDMLPIIGADPDYPSLIYACGHSRNGILMAPLTADCVAALITGAHPPADLVPFGIDRFSAPPTQRAGVHSA